MRYKDICEWDEDDYDEDDEYPEDYKRPVPWQPSDDELSEEEAKHFEEMWPKISSECSRMLNSMKAAEAKAHRMFLYRGVRNNPGAIVRSVSRTNRQPLATRKEIHDFMDAWFKENGFKATRSNSIFAASDFITANQYAVSMEKDQNPAVVIIIPTNSAAITWSPEVEDLYYYFPRHDGNREKWKAAMDKAGYKDHDLAAAIGSKFEVMISGAYWALDVRYANMIRRKLGV